MFFSEPQAETEQAPDIGGDIQSPGSVVYDRSCGFPNQPSQLIVFEAQFFLFFLQCAVIFYRLATHKLFHSYCVPAAESDPNRQSGQIDCRTTISVNLVWGRSPRVPPRKPS